MKKRNEGDDKEDKRKARRTREEVEWKGIAGGKRGSKRIAEETGRGGERRERRENGGKPKERRKRGGKQ